MIVVKCGGSVAEAAAAEIGALAAHEPVVVVHGAGPQISAELQRRGLEVSFVGGRRVTSADAIEVVREAFLAVNATLCAAVGPLALGLIGDQIGLRAEHIPELGLVGHPLPVRPQAVLDALDAGLIPVIAPIAEGPLNVNADEAASALAVGLGAQRILFLTDVPGVLHEDAVLERIHAADADRLVGDGTFEGGIVPKLVAAVRAARGGVRAEIGMTEVYA